MLTMHQDVQTSALTSQLGDKQRQTNANRGEKCAFVFLNSKHENGKDESSRQELGEWSVGVVISLRSD